MFSLLLCLSLKVWLILITSCIHRKSINWSGCVSTWNTTIEMTQQSSLTSMCINYTQMSTNFRWLHTFSGRFGAKFNLNTLKSIMTSLSKIHLYRIKITDNPFMIGNVFFFSFLQIRQSQIQWIPSKTRWIPILMISSCILFYFILLTLDININTNGKGISYSIFKNWNSSNESKGCLLWTNYWGKPIKNCRDNSIINVYLKYYKRRALRNLCANQSRH